MSRSREPERKPVEDTIAKVGGEVAVGQDLGFQRRWWRFERIAWTFFGVLLLCDLAGLFGRGPLAHARRVTSDGSVEMTYERVERTGAPAMLTLHFAASAIEHETGHGDDHDVVRVFFSDTLVRELGATRVIPQPESTIIGEGGFSYVFPVSSAPATVSFALQPAGPGVFPLRLRTEHADPVEVSIVVMP